MRCRFVQSMGCAALLAIAATASAAAELTAEQLRHRLKDASAATPVDLAGRDLSDLDLSGFDFQNAKLAGASLFASKLVNGNFKGSDLRSANLNGAWLMGADFSGADLTGASLLSVVVLGGAGLVAEATQGGERLAHDRPVPQDARQHVPIHVLPRVAGVGGAAHVRALAMLQQHQADDAKRRQHMKNQYQSMHSLSAALTIRRLADGVKFTGNQRCSADQAPVNIRHRKKPGRIGRLDAPSVQQG